jgi:hypothetical protein
MRSLSPLSADAQLFAYRGPMAVPSACCGGGLLEPPGGNFYGLCSVPDLAAGPATALIAVEAAETVAAMLTELDPHVAENNQQIPGQPCDSPACVS